MHYPIPPEPGTPADSHEYAEYWAERNKVELNDLREELAKHKGWESNALAFAVGCLITLVGYAVVRLLKAAPTMFLLACLTACPLAYSEPGVCYDMSVDGTLAKENKHVLRAEGVYHLWALHRQGVLTDSIYWARARKAAADGKFVWLNIEPDQSSVLAWRRPLNTLPELTTKFAQPVTLAQVESTHLLISSRLGPLCDQAKLTKAPVWDYRTLQVNSLELSVSDYARWKAETERIVGINNRAIAGKLHETGGGIIYEIYVPQQWNVPNHWLQTKAVIALERHAAVYDQLGVRSMPLLNPMTVGADGGKPVRVELLNSLIQSARSRGDWGWWSLSGQTTPALAKEVGAWIK